MIRFFLCLYFCLAGLLNADVLTTEFEKQISAYLLPEEHHLRGWLDLVFSDSHVLDNEESLRAAGFEVIACSSRHAAIMTHPSAPGYVFKMYVNTEKRIPRNKISGVEWLLRRCIGARILRKWIARQGIRHFVVPEKWLYPLSCKAKHPLVLIATDMQVESREMNAYVWKTLISHEHLDELYAILSQGYGSIYIEGNILYTKSGKFAFIDTEKPKHARDLTKIKPYLSESMQRYWDKLIR